MVPNINALTGLMHTITISLVMAVVIIYRLIWPILACVAMAILWFRGPQIAERLGDGLAPRFITVYDSTQFDHVTGKWDIETGMKLKSGENESKTKVKK